MLHVRAAAASNSNERLAVMSDAPIPPFSTRNRGAHRQIDGDFPATARSGLFHLLHDLVNRNCVDGWIPIDRELRRICRELPVIYDESYEDNKKARKSAEQLVQAAPWDKVLDFIERLHAHLAQDAYHWDSGKLIADMPRSAVQQHISEEIARLFLEENLAFEFRPSGGVWRRGRRHTVDMVSRAEVVLGDPRLDEARKHYNKAVKYFRDPSNSDPENVVKEAVCAVEATAKSLFPSAKGKTLADVINSITGSEDGKLPSAIAKTFHGLYGFRSGGAGVGHGGASGGPATPSIAEYTLSLAASQIILLVDLANKDSEVPF